MEKQNEIVVDDNAGMDSEFVKFERDKRKNVRVTNWRTVKTERVFDGQTRVVYEWRAECTEEDGQPTKKIVSLSNITFRKIVRDLTKNLPRDSSIFLSVKRLGEGKQTVYDVERLL